MARDNKVNLPSGMGGLVRYFDDYQSKFQIKPGAVIIICIAVMLIVIMLHASGGKLLGL